MNEYSIITPSGKITIKADSIEERTSHFVLLRKTKETEHVTENEVIAVCPKNTQFIIIKVG